MYSADRTIEDMHVCIVKTMTAGIDEQIVDECG
jgi:hypothetical protein